MRAPIVVGLAALAASLSAGCSQKDQHPTLPAPPPPGVLAVFPAPRAVRVPDDTEIWARFDNPLDPATVNERTVFLKIDTQRVPITVTYESSGHRIRLRTGTLLRLRQAYTVELSPRVATADGTELGQTYSWEFTTVGVRRVTNPFPPHQSTGESPFVPLSWKGTEPEFGDIMYRIYLSADVNQVTNRTVAPRIAVVRPYLLASPRWDLGSTFFWSVTAVNRTTGEEANGPVWKFNTLPPGLPIDSLTVTVSGYGYFPFAPDPFPCNQSIWVGGPDINSAIGWQLESLPADLRLAGCTIALKTFQLDRPNERRLGIWGIESGWNPCTMAFPGPPYHDNALGQLAISDVNAEGGGLVFRFDSEALTSHIQGSTRGIGLKGYIFRVGRKTNYIAPDVNAMTLRFYRVTP